MPQPTVPPEVFLDLRGLFPPEPMERVLDALAGLLAGQQIRLLIEREPHPLFRILEKKTTATVAPNRSRAFTKL